MLFGINWERVLGIYVLSVIPTIFLIFAVLLISIFIPAVAEAAAQNDSTPGVGLFLIFFALASGPRGAVVAIPVSLMLDQVLYAHEVPHKPFYERFIS